MLTITSIADLASFQVASYLVALSTIFVLGVLGNYAAASRRPKGFPPGPPPLPILGNLHQLPLNKAFLKFHEWSKTYGSIVGLKLGSQNVVVLNSYKHVRELLDKRGSIYSSRPPNHVGNDILCRNETHILLVPYGPGWRSLRKAVQSMLNVNAVDDLTSVQNAESSQTMFELLRHPQNCFQHFRRYSSGVILASVYGQRGEAYNSAKVQALYHAQEQFTSILAPGATPPVDVFPLLKYLPDSLSGWRAKAKAIRKEQRSLYYRLLNETKQRLTKSSAPECFLGKLIEAKEKNGLDEEHIVYTGGTLFEAGSDTTASSLQSWLIAMTEHPDVLSKLQAEVDRVCGTERMPSVKDASNLPYTRAVMNETLRWRPVAPGGVPHLLIQDDHYEGYFFPKDTMFFANTWAIHQDESEYEKPSEFIPERFLNDKFGTYAREKTATDEQRRVTYSFGAGRRVCPGQRLAENSLMTVIPRVAWGFNISADPAHRIDSRIDSGFSDGFVFSPLPFKARLDVRSPKHEEIILKEYEAAKAFFKQYEE